MTPTPPATGQPAAPATGAPAQPDNAALQKEITDLRAALTKREEAAQYWYEKANEKPAPAAAAPPTATNEPDDQTDLLEMITTGGPKALLTYIKKQGGFLTQEEAEALADEKVNSKANQIATEGQLLEDYPDLADDQSEFFKATALEYHQLVNAGVPKNMAMRLAAQSIELGGLKSGKIKTPQQRSAEQREQDRLARISAQGGTRGTRATENLDDENDTEITPAERASIQGMLVGDPHPKTGKRMNFEEAVEVYRERAKSGVRVSTRSRR